MTALLRSPDAELLGEHAVKGREPVAHRVQLLPGEDRHLLALTAQNEMTRKLFLTHMSAVEVESPGLVRAMIELLGGSHERDLGKRESDARFLAILSDSCHSRLPVVAMALATWEFPIVISRLLYAENALRSLLEKKARPVAPKF